MTRIVDDLEAFKVRESNKAIIPSLRLFAVGSREFVDLMSKDRGDLVSSMHCTHLINKRSFEVFQDKIESRCSSLHDEQIDAIVLEITVDRKARLNKFYWIKFTPDEERGIGLERLLTLAACMKQGRSIEQARLLTEQTPYQRSLEGAGLLATLLISVSSKPEDKNENRYSLSILQNLEGFAQISTTRSKKEDPEGAIRYTHTERIFGGRISHEETKNPLESRLSKLVQTYKSAGFTDDDENSEPVAPDLKYELKSPEPELVSSLKMLRTKRKLHAMEKRMEEFQGTQDQGFPLQAPSSEFPIQYHILTQTTGLCS